MIEMEFPQKIYHELDQKLKSTDFNSGVSEAHGLLVGLACRGVAFEELQNKLYLFQLSGNEDLILLQGLFELILRDLQSSTPTFDLLLPADDVSLVIRADEISNWCGGYMQGFCHDGDYIFTDSNDTTREMLRDIMDIGGLHIDEADREESEKALMEIEEYLRVGVQLIYDETTNSDKSTALPDKNELH